MSSLARRIWLIQSGYWTATGLFSLWKCKTWKQNMMVLRERPFPPKATWPVWCMYILLIGRARQTMYWLLLSSLVGLHQHYIPIHTGREQDPILETDPPDTACLSPCFLSSVLFLASEVYSCPLHRNLEHSIDTTKDQSRPKLSRINLSCQKSRLSAKWGRGKYQIHQIRTRKQSNWLHVQDKPSKHNHNFRTPSSHPSNIAASLDLTTPSSRTPQETSTRLDIIVVKRLVWKKKNRTHTKQIEPRIYVCTKSKKITLQRHRCATRFHP